MPLEAHSTYNNRSMKMHIDIPCCIQYTNAWINSFWRQKRYRKKYIHHNLIFWFEFNPSLDSSHSFLNVSFQTVRALSYLKTNHDVIHRDVKPSNILIDERGNIKLCDFGISGRLVDSKAKTRSAGCAAYMAVSVGIAFPFKTVQLTFVFKFKNWCSRFQLSHFLCSFGKFVTKIKIVFHENAYYKMNCLFWFVSVFPFQPERIDPKKPEYDIRADVWSLGITLVELATGSFPYVDCNNDFEVLTQILGKDPPRLPTDQGFSLEFQNFVSKW